MPIGGREPTHHAIQIQKGQQRHRLIINHPRIKFTMLKKLKSSLKKRSVSSVPPAVPDYVKKPDSNNAQKTAASTHDQKTEASNDIQKLEASNNGQYPEGSNDAQKSESSNTAQKPEVQKDAQKLERFGLFFLNQKIPGPDEAVYPADIIAIHGFNGSPYSTWTHSDGTMWLRDLLPTFLPGSRVFTFGYPTKNTSPSLARIQESSRNLLNSIRDIQTQACLASAYSVNLG